MGTGPLGYINKVNEAGKKYIAPRDDEADILKWAFNELALGRFNTEQIWKLAREKGLNRGNKNIFGSPSVIPCIAEKYLFLSSRMRKAASCKGNMNH